MLREIRLENFKCFREESIFPIGNVTLLTGVNGKGKSSFVQSLLIPSQSISSSQVGSEFYLNSSLVELGSYDDVKSVEAISSSDMKMTYEYESEDGEFVNIQYTLHRKYLDSAFGEVEEEGVLSINKIVINSSMLDCCNANLQEPIELKNLLPNEIAKNIDIVNKLNIGFDRIHFISADRIGPSTFHHIDSSKSFKGVGKKGEHTAGVIYKCREANVNEVLRLESSETIKVPDQITAWVSHIFNSGKIEIESISESLKKLSINCDGSISRFKPENVGYGFSYSLPIIVSGLTAKKGDVLIIENPEAHLHPSAQSRIMFFLSLVAKSGVIVIIETHSQNILNGLRVSVKKDILKAEDVSVLFFGDYESRRTLKVEIDRNGQIEHWPQGFFDQDEKDLDCLYEI
jgi:predicted ATPase